MHDHSQGSTTINLELSICVILGLILVYIAKLRNHFSFCAAFIPFLAAPIFKWKVEFFCKFWEPYTGRDSHCDFTVFL